MIPKFFYEIVYLTIFSNADAIDLYVGAMTEESAGGSILGPTFTCLTIKQFSLIRASDRYWYERPGMFTLGKTL